MPNEHEPPAASPNESNRRDFLERALGAGAAVWAAGIAVPTGIYLWPAAASGAGCGQCHDLLELFTEGGDPPHRPGRHQRHPAGMRILVQHLGHKMI